MAPALSRHAIPLTSHVQILKNEQKPAVELCAERELSTYSRFTRARCAATILPSPRCRLPY